MARLLISDTAKNDLLSIRTYTNKVWGARQAKAYLVELREAFRQLQAHPLSGSSAEDLGDGIRKISCGSHTIYYTLIKDDLHILTLLHQSMLPRLHAPFDSGKDS